jgi:hypothetical protein
MKYDDLNDGMEGIYMIARPYKLDPSKIEREDWNQLIVKVGRSKNLIKRVENYLEIGYHEDEIACQWLNGYKETALFELFFKKLFGAISILDKHKGHEWFISRGIRFEDTLDEGHRGLAEREMIDQLFKAFENSYQHEPVPLYEWGISYGVKLPGMLLSKQTICEYIKKKKNKASYDDITKHFGKCIISKISESLEWYCHNMPQRPPGYRVSQDAMRAILGAMVQEKILSYDDDLDVYAIRNMFHDFPHKNWTV